VSYPRPPRLARLTSALPAPRAAITAGFRSILSGDPGGTPDWVRAMEHGADAGYFGPDSPVWAVHGDLATLVGGVRALLMQALHPAAVTGVDQHSTYRQDPLGRLSGTTRWLTVTTFAAREGADREAARVRGMHRRVSGRYVDATGQDRPYAASDDRLLAWVHAAFTDSFLTTHLTFGGNLPGGPDEYVRTWATSAKLIGLADPPSSMAELNDQIDGFGPELAHTPATAATLAFLRRPPLPAPARAGYQVLLAAAVSTLRPQHRQLLHLPARGTVLPQVGARALLAALRVVLGEGPPAAAAARTRLHRLSASAQQERRDPGACVGPARPGNEPAAE
jgi:uncharacterized protein (DUF2236 family)